MSGAEYVGLIVAITVGLPIMLGLFGPSGRRRCRCADVTGDLVLVRASLGRIEKVLAPKEDSLEAVEASLVADEEVR